jgi:hypothetical protein
VATSINHQSVRLLCFFKHAILSMNVADDGIRLRVACYITVEKSRDIEVKPSPMFAASSKCTNTYTIWHQLNQILRYIPSNL